MGKVELPKRRASPELVCVEAAQLPLHGVLVGRGHYRAFTNDTVRPRQRQTTPVTSCDDQLSSTQASVYVHVMVVNFSHEELKLPKGAVLGLAEQTSASIVAAINDESSSPSHSEKTPRGDNTELEDTWFKQYLQDRLEHLNKEERSVMQVDLGKCRNVFHRVGSDDFQGTDVVEHRIITGDAKPIRKPPYRVPFALRKEMNDQIQDMLNKGIIEQSCSP